MQVDRKRALNHQQILLNEYVLTQTFFEDKGLVEDLHGKVFLETLVGHVIHSAKATLAQNSMKNVLAKTALVLHALGYLILIL